MREYRVYLIDERVGSPFFGERLEIARNLDMTSSQERIDSIYMARTALSYHSICTWKTGKLGDWMSRDNGGVRSKPLPKPNHENIRNATNAKNRSLESDCEERRITQDVLWDRTLEQAQPEKTASLHLPTAGSGSAGERELVKTRPNPTFNSTHY